MTKAVRVGILGGGQLAQMLAEAAERIQVEPVIFCASKSDPAAQVCKEVVIGTLDDEKALQTFFSKVEVVTYESDFLPFERLKKFKDAIYIPELELLSLMSNKIKQKQLLTMLRIPTASFEVFEGDPGGIEGWLDQWWEKHNGGVVKWARGGYDGKGVEASGNFDSALLFAKEAIAAKRRIFVEERVPFVRELALVSCFSIEDVFGAYPLVISEQKSGICFRVLGPAVKQGVSEELEKDAVRSAKKLAIQLELHGTFALEFFETADGKILVNEIAPRVHNSGHFSLQASKTSQFENHIRAILGRPLGPTESLKPKFGMQNLIGMADREFPRAPELASNGFLKWYGKSEARRGRKMGHVNFVFEEGATAAQMRGDMDKAQKSWEAQFS